MCIAGQKAADLYGAEEPGAGGWKARLIDSCQGGNTWWFVQGFQSEEIHIFLGTQSRGLDGTTCQPTDPQISFFQTSPNTKVKKENRFHFSMIFQFNGISQGKRDMIQQPQCCERSELFSGKLSSCKNTKDTKTEKVKVAFTKVRCITYFKDQQSNFYQSDLC